MPLCIKLRLNKFNDFLLLGSNSNLLFAKPIQFSLPFSDLFSLLVDVRYPGVWIFAPDIQDRDTNIFTQIIESLLLKQR